MTKFLGQFAPWNFEERGEEEEEEEEEGGRGCCLWLPM